MVSTKAQEQEVMVTDIGTIRESMDSRQEKLESELIINQEKIDQQLEELNTKMLEAIESAKVEAIAARKCCTIS